MLDNLKGYRTVIFNVIMGLLLIWRSVAPADEIPTDSQVQTLVDTVFSALDAILVVGNILLRKVTDTPLGQKY